MYNELNLRIVTYLTLLFGAFFWGCSEPAQEGPGAEGGLDRIPAWAQDAVWYQIFPERFRNGDTANDPVRSSLEFPENVSDKWRVTPWTGDWYERDEWERERGTNFYEDGVFDRRLGGDLQGVIDQLAYLDSLGVNALYFNPVFYARSLHKYDGNSFHHVDPYFGPDPNGDLAIIASETADPETWQWTAADRLFLELLDRAHARDIRVIIDGVWNHTGRDFFAFKSIRELQEASPYKDWYIVKAYDDPATAENEFAYKGWWDVDTLPEFADTKDRTDLHPEPKSYVFAATKRWMDPDGDGDPSDGVNGWRLDVTEEVPIKFWQDWNDLVFSINPEAYTVTEIWTEASDFLSEGGFSATMNYHAFAMPAKGFFMDRTIAPEAFKTMLDERRSAFAGPRAAALQNLFDSHDTDRLASMIVNASADYKNRDRYDYDEHGTNSPRHTENYLLRAPTSQERALQRLAILFQMTYVGAPMIYYGTEAGMWGADDPDDRMPMVWPDMEYATMSTKGQEGPQVVAFDDELFALYRELITTRMRFDALRSDQIQMLEGPVFGYDRRSGDEYLRVLFNPSDESVDVEGWLDELGPAAARPLVMLGMGEADLAKTGMPPRSAVLLRIMPED